MHVFWSCCGRQITVNTCITSKVCKSEVGDTGVSYRFFQSLLPPNLCTVQQEPINGLHMISTGYLQSDG